MANGTNGPFGLQPVQSQTASTFSGALAPYNINPNYNTPIYSGDPVTMGNDGTIKRWAPGQTACGTFWGCKYLTTIQTLLGNVIFSPYWPGTQSVPNGALVQALVINDPSVLYNIQASHSGNVNAADVQLGVTFHNIGLNADVALGGTFTDVERIAANNPAGGSNLSGQSGYYLDTSTIRAQADALLKIVRLTPTPSNVFYTAPNNRGVGNGRQGAFNNVICQINNQESKGGTGTAGGTLLVHTGTITAAQLNGMYAAPHQILPQPGDGFAIIVNSVTLSVDNFNNNTSFAAGGEIGFQYGPTIHLGGTQVTSRLPATILTSNPVGSGPFVFNGVPVTPVNGDSTAGAIYISNLSAAFTTGTPQYKFTVTYSIVPFPY